MQKLLLLSPAWVPKLAPGALRVIVVHWTAGTNSVSSLDKSHYHFIIDGETKIHRGFLSVAANARPFSSLRPYAAHTRNFNAGAIGVSLCGMAGATESPFRPGPYPITEAQWETAAQVVAELCHAYNIPVTRQTVLQHGEVQKQTGVVQRGKWDCCKLPWLPHLSPDEVCDQFRMLVAKKLSALKSPTLRPENRAPAKLWLEVEGSTEVLIEGAQKREGHWDVPGDFLSALGHPAVFRAPYVALRGALAQAGYSVTAVRQLRDLNGSQIVRIRKVTK